MTTLIHICTLPLVHALGWTLLHLCWQGTLVAVVLWCVLGLLSGRSSQARYAVACLALGLMIALPLATFAHLAADEYRLRATLDGPAMVLDPGMVLRVEAGDLSTPWLVRMDVALEHALPWVLLAWSAGVIFFVGRLNLGLLVARRMRALATTLPPVELQQAFDALRRRLGVGRAVQLMHSAIVEVPTVIGWLRPIVLIPASCLTGLSTMQIEAILAHELAHIRRHDYLVNVLQSVIETLLFYHPAVWWVSKQVRRERECCCDELAVAVGGDRLGYARALSVMEERRSYTPELVLGANGGVLTMRIKRLLGYKEDAAISQFAAFAVLAILMAVAGSYVVTTARAESRAAQAAAQDNRAIKGSVTDNTGVPVAGAKLTAVNTDDGAKTVRESDASGKYSFSPLPVGPYNVEVEAKGFFRLLQENVRVDGKAPVVLNMKLRAGAADRTMTITDAPRAVTPAPPPVGNEFAGRKIAEVFFKGLNSVPLSQVDVRLKSVGAEVRLGTAFDPEWVGSVVQAMKGLLAEHGRPSATVTPVIRKIAPSAVGVTFEVKEGPAASRAKLASYSAPVVASDSIKMAAAQVPAAGTQTAADAAQGAAPSPPHYDFVLEVPATPHYGPVRTPSVFPGTPYSLVYPVYPEEAKEKHVGGQVVLHAVISKNGTVEDLTVVSGPQELRQSAIDAVRQLTYNPYLKNGQPVEFEKNIALLYNLPDSTPVIGPVPPADEAANGVKQVGGDVTAPRIIYEQDPEYTDLAKTDKVQGAVLVGMVVDEQGLPQHVHVLHGLGDGLDEKAVEAVSQYKCKPGMENGRPVPVYLKVEVNFKIF